MEEKLILFEQSKQRFDKKKKELPKAPEEIQVVVSTITSYLSTIFHYILMKDEFDFKTKYTLSIKQKQLIDDLFINLRDNGIIKSYEISCNDDNNKSYTSIKVDIYSLSTNITHKFDIYVNYIVYKEGGFHVTK